MSKWGKVKLERYIEQIRGVSYKPSDVKVQTNKNAIGILRANNIQDDGMNFNDLVYIDSSKVSTVQKINKGDILICTSSGSKHLVGKACTANKSYDLSFGAFCKIVRSEKIYNPYLGHYFKSSIYRQTISKFSSGANINNIKNEHIYQLEIPLPPLEVQEEIARNLDLASDLVKLHNSKLEELDKLIQSVFYDMFGDPVLNEKVWDVVKVRNVAKFQGGYAFKSKDYVRDGVKLVQITNVSKDKLIWDDANYLPLNYKESYKKFVLKNDDIVMAMTRPIIKSLNSIKIATISKADEGALLNQRVGRFLINYEYLNNIYLISYCQTKYFMNIVERFAGNSLQPNVSSDQIESVDIMLPPLELQQKFANIVTEIKQQEVQVQQALDDSEMLYKSLMQSFFE